MILKIAVVGPAYARKSAFIKRMGGEPTIVTEETRNPPIVLNTLCFKFGQVGVVFYEIPSESPKVYERFIHMCDASIIFSDDMTVDVARVSCLRPRACIIDHIPDGTDPSVFYLESPSLQDDVVMFLVSLFA